jgi:crossover junction endodeoxyribonuclease RuvC
LPADRRSIRCLGIDPGIGRLGFGLVLQSGTSLEAVEYGCLETRPGEDLPRRLLVLFSSLQQIVARLDPDILAVERLFFGRNTTTAEAVWQARGVVLLLAAQRGLDLYQPKPAEVKMAVAGTGSATKTQVQRMVCEILRLGALPKPDDAADALAIAMTGLAMHAAESRIRALEGRTPC